MVPVFELFRPGAEADLEDLVAAADSVRFNERALRRRWMEGGGEPLARAALQLAAAGEVDYTEAASLDSDLFCGHSRHACAGWSATSPARWLCLQASNAPSGSAQPRRGRHAAPLRKRFP